jgi:DNA replication protein
MNMLPYIDKIAGRAKANIPVNPEDYTDPETGLLMCGKCHTPKQVRITVCGETREPFCLCDCLAQTREKARKDEEEAKRREDIPLMRERCFRRLYGAENGMQGVTVSACEGWTFAQDDFDDPITSRVSMNYVEHFDEMRRVGKGLFFFGSVGGGKSFFAACIANALIDKAIPCYFTSVSEIVGRIRNGDRSEIDGLSRYPLIVLDDLGAERNTPYMAEMVFDVIDNRVRSGLPMIVTSNYTRDEIGAAADVQMKRVFSRIFEVCIPVEIKHKDRRRAKLADEIGHYRKLLGLEGT